MFHFNFSIAIIRAATCKQEDRLQKYQQVSTFHTWESEKKKKKKKEEEAVFYYISL